MPEHVRPAQRQNLRRSECGRRAGEHQRVMKRGGEGFQNRYGLGRVMMIAR